MNAYAQKAYNAYQKTEVMTITPGELVAKLLVAAESAISKGMDAMEQGKIATKGEQFSRAIAILGELQASLDFDQGGEIAENLNAIYDFCIREILTGNLKNDPARIEAALSTLSPVTDAWMTLKNSSIQDKGQPEMAPKAKTGGDANRLQAAL